MKKVKLFEQFLNEETSFPAGFAIDDMVEFTPTAKQAENRAITRDYRMGTIVKVSFSKAKVFYDILDDYYGEIFTNVDSSFVKPIEKLNLEENNIVEAINPTKKLLNNVFRSHGIKTLSSTSSGQVKGWTTYDGKGYKYEYDGLISLKGFSEDDVQNIIIDMEDEGVKITNWTSHSIEYK